MTRERRRHTSIRTITFGIGFVITVSIIGVIATIASHVLIFILIACLPLAFLSGMRYGKIRDGSHVKKIRATTEHGAHENRADELPNPFTRPFRGW